jgi:DNA-binding CsgD family transcriptional regulator
MEHRSELRTRWMLGLVGVGAFATLLGLEIATDDDAMRPLKLLLESLELALTIAAAAGFTLLAGRIRQQHEERLALMSDLAQARVEGERWRRQVQSHLDGLGTEIERQFDVWGLTGAEAQVALLMIKGLSHKEIAMLRRTSEATVRQQARSAYEKAGLKGRAAFSAYFLEDLLPSSIVPPAPSRAPQGGAATGSDAFG